MRTCSSRPRSKLLCSFLLAVPLIGASASAQNPTRQAPHGVGSYSVFGSGCPGSRGIPTLVPVSRPVVGKSFTVEIRNLPPGPAPFAAVGFSDTTWAGHALPLNLGSFGMPGCTLYASRDICNMRPPIVAGTARWQIPIPNDANLVGLSFFQQAIVLEANINPRGAIVTNAGEGIIGAR